MSGQQLVEQMTQHDSVGDLLPHMGYWGILDPLDLGNGDYTERWGRVPANDPQFLDVQAFVAERCKAASPVKYFTPTGGDPTSSSVDALATYVVYEHASGRTLAVDSVILARVPNQLIPQIIAFFGQTPLAPGDVYPGLAVREAQATGNPVDTSWPWPEMGERCYHPSTLDNPSKYPPYNPITDADRSKARYQDPQARIYEVFERVIGTSWFGGPPAKKVRVWQLVNW